MTGVVERRQTLPVLANFLVVAKGGELAVTGTDMEVELVGTISADIAQEGEITVPARKLLDIVRALPDGSAIELSVQDEKATMVAGRSRYTLSTLPAAEFPATDQVETLEDVVLPEREGDDVRAIQTVLAISAELGGLPDVPIVVEVADPITAQRLVHAFGPMMHPIVTAEAVARTGALALRQRGLSKVVAELTDFHGCDLHVAVRPELVGVRFDEIVGRFRARRRKVLASRGAVSS